MSIVRSFIDYPNKRKVFRLVYKSARPIVSFYGYVFISTFFARIYSVYFLVSDVANQESRGEEPGAPLWTRVERKMSF